MIITTRFRDIPVDEARKCYADSAGLTVDSWERLKSTPIGIVAPARESRQAGFSCRGPFFDVIPLAKGRFTAGAEADTGESRFMVCPHIALIGD